MALLRFNITGAVPLPLTPEQQTFIDDLVAKLHILKEHCVVINPGSPDEEDITHFTYHICNHDTGGICGVDQDI